MRHDEFRLIDEVLAGRMSRRDLIKRLMAAGVSLSAMTALLRASGVGGEAEAASMVEARSVHAKRGGSLNFATVVPATDVDPVTMFNEGAIFTAEVPGEYLAYPRPDYSLAPKLAISWHATRPDVWTFNLRQGVKWHDGKPFTADDVVATFDRLTDPHVNSAALSAYKGILSKGHTRKNNAHQVTFHLDRPYVDFPYLVSAFTYNAIILPKNYKIGTFTRGGIGTGPYILTKYTPKVSAQFVRNPHYWNKSQAYLDSAVMKYYADNSAIVLALESGAADVFLDMPYQGSQALFANSSIRVLKNPSSAYREFHMRVDQKPFSDKRVRQAVALSLNRPELIQGLWHGLGQVGNDHPFAPIYPTSAKAMAGLPQRKNDYAAAKKLLAQAGYPHGFTATLTTENFLEIPQYAVFIKQQLAPAGINVNLHVEDQTTYYGAGSNQPWLQVPMGIVDWAPRGAASQTIAPAYLCNAIWNTPHWCNSRFNSLISQYDRELNKARRQQIALEAATVIHDEVPAVIAYWIEELRATRSNVGGLAKGPASLFDPAPVYRSA
ncbi:MAG: ABC transporter substrate-binding protein [Chloroflexi bacterium]|nr:ABC transporter substrate-binding protein [Chloroflexota bacterium]